MSTRIRTLNFLPEIFQTPTNTQFLSATLDQLVQQPQTLKIEGYIGQKFGYGINAKDKYVVEPSKTRTDYQLEPGVVFTKTNENTAQDFISYPGIIDGLKSQGSISNNNDRLFTSEFYSWDSFVDLDKLINFTQYYWLPKGPESVVVSVETVFFEDNYNVDSLSNGYTISPVASSVSSTINPTLTLLRGGSYTFNLNQNTQFWIQGYPGITGNSPTQSNLSVRDIYGVNNNGATTGVITFNVPSKDAQDSLYLWPGNNIVDLISTIPFAEIQGKLVNSISIDSITSLEGLTVMFYNTGQPEEIGYVSNFFDYTPLDQNDNLTPLQTITVTATNFGTNTIVCNSTENLIVGNAIIFDGISFGGISIYSTTLPNTIYFVESIVNSTEFRISLNPNGPVFTLTTATGSMTGTINQGQFEQGYSTVVNDTFYQITYIGDPGQQVIRLVKTSLIPINQKITAQYGNEFIARTFYKDTLGTIYIYPFISAPLDTLYYQDGTNPNKVGIIKIIDQNVSNTLNVNTEILGKTQYTAPNKVEFTNGLKIKFQGDVIPRSYLSGEYYVEGVGTSIQLLSVEDFIVPESLAGVSYPWDITGWDSNAWEGDTFIPVTPDYITIARASIDKNAWSRGNRWFHIDVLKATALYNNNSTLLTTYISNENKAKRPIIEFYPNLKLFNSGTEGKNPVDFVDTRTTDAFSLVASKQNYYPDIEVYTKYTGTINSTNYVSSRDIISGSNTTGIFTCDTGFNTTGFNINDIIIFDNITPGSEIFPGILYYVVEISSSTQFKISTIKNGNVLIPSIAITGPYSFTWSPQSISVTIATNDILKGNFTVGQYITDAENVLPTNAQITSITGTSTLTLTLEWNQTGQYFNSATNVSFLASDTTVDNYSLFENATIIFTKDTNPEVKNKIYKSNFSFVDGSPIPVITLTEIDNGLVLNNQQTVAIRGYYNQGNQFYYYGNQWFEGQRKNQVNQPPLFDIVDENNISFSDTDVYLGSSFNGCKLFSYGIGTGLDDNILGFPIRYSSINNIGDISFDVPLNGDVFNYVVGDNPIEQKINTGFVLSYINRTDSNKNIGWKTAVSPSIQYQFFSFNFEPNITQNEFICDIEKNNSSSTNWPTVLVFNNNKPYKSSEFTVTVSENQTTIILNESPVVETIIQILVYSNEVSSTAYYTIPINLNNNPLNEDITFTSIGDIRLHYQSIFLNNPNIKGEIFGENNYHNLGNLVSWGNKIIQNSASLVLPGTFLRKSNYNLNDALNFNCNEYVKYKNLLLSIVENSNYVQNYNPSYLLDDALDQITLNKSENQSFFWSDMLPGKAAYKINTYTFANSLDVSVYPLTKIYDFNKANYSGILVYLERIENNVTKTIQLVKDTDYIVSDTTPSLTITLDLLPNDKIIIKEYNQTYGSYVPNTPTKLGLYPKFIPQVILDQNYTVPTYFICGHDGSFTKLYGDYDPNTDTLIDFRDQVLLEFEKRIYNNLKLSTVLPIQEFEIIPGFFRTIDYPYNDWLTIYSESFLDWIGKNRLDYKTQLYQSNDKFTYNYYQSGNKLNNQPIDQGYWRGIYLYFYDTSTPNETPWQMLGYKNQPIWWENRYGPKPYTSDNIVLWQDLENGIDYNNGDPIVIEKARRPGLLNIIPVDSEGNLRNPFDAVLGNYNQRLFQRDWKVGDVAPVEFSFRRSSNYPFVLVKLMALMYPAKFYNLAVDLDNYKYNFEFNQWLVNGRSHLQINQIEIYGTGTAKTSYINWLVDYGKQIGLSSTENIETLLDNLDVRLIYRLAGFSDKKLLKFYVEKGTPNNTNASLLIPDESYNVLLYDNQYFDRIIYSSIVIQITSEGAYTIHGNSQNYGYFKTLKPKFDGKYKNISIEGVSVKLNENYYDVEQIVPYGAKFYSPQEVSQFIADYSAYLELKGMKFTEQENDIIINWDQMIAEFLYWSQMSWETGSVINLNPAAKKLIIDKENNIVQPLIIQQSNFVLNQNLYPIQTKDLSILRDSFKFEINALNQGDSISYGQFNLSNFEHGIVFDNVTVFDDVIYNLISGLRQLRIIVKGVKSAEWNGTVNASGFIYNQDNIKEWNSASKYTKGEIVTYKNKYWTALKIIQPSIIFNELDWKITDYDEIQKGLLPNSSTSSYEMTLYYDTEQTNLEKDTDVLSFGLIGYRPREYMSLADLTDITQINVYKNLIKNKGTANALNAFKGATLPQGGINYEIYENWAIKSGTFGGVLNNNFFEFKINEKYLTSNPTIVGLTNGQPYEGSQQLVPIYSLYNYKQPINDVNVLSTLSSNYYHDTFLDAGYVNFNDVKMSAYFYSQLPIAVNKQNLIVSIDEFYVRDYIWLANFKERWEVFTPSSIGIVINASNNLNGTVTVTFNKPHNLTQYQPFAIINFDININGYYLATLIIDANNIIINKDLNQQIKNITGNGVALLLQSNRVDSPADIINLPLLNTEFTKNTVWVDTDNTGSWGVYGKSINYKNENQITKSVTQNFGSAVKIIDASQYLISDIGTGAVYKYALNDATKEFDLNQTITQSGSFGYAIGNAGDIYSILNKSGNAVKIYQLQNTNLSKNLVEIQSISVTTPESVAMSGDQKWLFVGIPSSDEIKVYKQEYIPTTSGYFVIGQVYEITSLGTTDFTLLGAISNIVGVKFNATGIGTGNGTANKITYNLVTTIDGISLGLVIAGDNFGKSIATDYYGNNIFISAPYQDNGTISNWGYTYIFDRTTQNIEIQYSNVYPGVQTLQLAYTPTTVQKTVSSTTSPSTITLNNTSGLSLNDPIIFSTTGSGLLNTNISPNVIYYINSIAGSNITLKETRESVSAFTVTTNGSVTATLHAQTETIFVYRNGTLVTDNNYGIINDKLIYTNPINAGDIITVSGRLITHIQTLTTEEPVQIGAQFGLSLDVNRYGNECLIGAPFQLNSQLEEGTVYRFTDPGSKYGTIAGVSECNVTTPRKLLINGYLVNIPVGNATTVANVINASLITNVRALSIDNKLQISLVNYDLSQINSKLTLNVVDNITLSELGIKVFIKTQEILCPHLQGATQFGSLVKFDELDSVIISAPVGTRFASTTFDFIDDENQDNDTIFDNNSTQWIDQTPNFGAVYMFDYLSQYQESLTNVGKFIYAQSLNSLNFVKSGNTYDQETDITYSNQPRYGTAIDFNKYGAIIGTPDDRGVTNGAQYLGSVTTFKNLSETTNWGLYRYSSPIVDVNKINSALLYSAETNETLINLDYIDPLQGKLLGAVRQNIDVISSVDPASYNNNTTLPGNIVWGSAQIGTIWLNTANMRFVNYHQNNDNTYNAKYWASLFPGSDVAVYSWISSNVLPINYQGTGVPYDFDLYSTQFVINSSGALTSIYYYWVRGTNNIFYNNQKTLADSVIESYISNPIGSGIAFASTLLPNLLGLYNSNMYFNANDTVLHVGYASGNSDNVSNEQFDLIRDGNPDDFLYGIPLFPGQQPTGLYDRLLDSLSGVDELGSNVPNPYLPKLVQSGILARPRQSFFFNRYQAIKNYLQFTNSILSKYPITEIRQNLTFLFTKNSEIYETVTAGNCQSGVTYTIETVGEVDWMSIGAPMNAAGIIFVATGPVIGEYRNTGTASFLAFNEGEKYDTQNYWEYINWWATGYDNNTKSTLQVNQYSDLSTLNVATDTIVTVDTNNTFNAETYIFKNNQWTRIGLKNGTIAFKSGLYDYSTGRTGYGDNFFDTGLFDLYPSEETKYIVRAINEQIFTEDLLIYRNKSLILLFEYIQSETIENENYLPWLNKTSFIDVSHTIRELRPIEIYQNDNQEFLYGYINEAKPYHVVIKEFLFKYTGNEIYDGNVTDFDLPAQYNTTVQEFITPELVNDNPSSFNQYLPSSSIWQEKSYNQWFENRGVRIGLPYNTEGSIEYLGEKDYLLTTLASYIALNSDSFAVDNAQGFPVNGTIKIGNESIGYSTVDRAFNVLSGLTRGVNGTPIETHIPGSKIMMDLPAIIVLESGRGYINPPKVSAYVNTAIYSEPIRPAALTAILNADGVIGIKIEDPGQGYMVIPQIIIDPSIIVTFSSSDVVVLGNFIKLYAPLLQTGDMVQYKIGENTTPINGLKPFEWYYINVLETLPTVIVALYNNYANAILDHDRINLYDTGSGENHTFNLGARASAVTSASPVRENQITLRFDRTTYNSQLINWQSGSYYGAFYAGNYSNSESVSSSSISLQSTQPPINSIFASAQGVAFEIVTIENQRTITYSSFVRQVDSTYSSNNSIKLILQDDGSGNPNASGGTLGFYIGMPIKFSGYVGSSGLIGEQIYYVNSIITLTEFTISTNSTGSPVQTLTNFSVGSQQLRLYVGEVKDVAIATVNYPGILPVSSTEKTTNYISIPLYPTGTGGTKGFYIGLPVFFTGLVPTSPNNGIFGGIIENQPYFVTTVIDNERFTISETPTPKTFTVLSTLASNDTITIDGDTTQIDINEPIIFNTMMISGVETTNFGGLISGQLYYVSSIISTISFTVSLDINGTIVPLSTISASGTTSALLISQSETLTLTTQNVENNTGLNDIGMVVNVSLPVSPGQINGQKFSFYQTSINYPNVIGTNSVLMYRIINAFIGDRFTINANSLIENIEYKITFVGTTDFTLLGAASNTIGVRFIANGTGTGTGTGTVTQVVNSIILDNFIPGEVATLGLTNIYNNMPLEISDQFGPAFLATGNTYYVVDKGIVEINITSTSSTGNQITCDDTSLLYIDMPILFSGTGVGNVEIDVEYWVKSIVDRTHFTISNSPGGLTLTLTTDSGNMICTGLPYIKVSNTVGGTSLYTGDTQQTTTITIATPAVFTVNEAPSNGKTVIFRSTGSLPGGVSQNTTYYVRNRTSNTFNISLTPAGSLINTSGTQSGVHTMIITNDVQFDQTPLSIPEFAISNIIGGYRVIITNAASGYAINNEIVISGLFVGGANITNDCTLLINEIGSLGEIVQVIVSGTPVGEVNQYYLKVISSTKFEIYANPLMTVPVSGIGLPYIGITQSTVTNVNSTTEILTLTNASGFTDNDSVVFTGDLTGVSNVISEGTTYYITSVSGNDITVSATPNGTNINFTSTTATNFTIGKFGSFALLPEPFIFNQSIVKYNNKVYICIISNNDKEFVFGKWEELSSGDRRLNAMDRVLGYYEPTDNMPGIDLTQLFEGVSYPNSIYLGNAFAPEQQFELDTVLQDQPFYPRGVKSCAVTWDGTKFVIASNTPDASNMLYSSNGVDWVLSKVSNFSIQLTDIIFANNTFVATSNNTATPIFRSNDGVTWTTNGYYTPYGSTPYDDTNYDSTSLSVSALSLNSVAFNSAFNLYIAVGEKIISSVNTYDWINRFEFSNSLTNNLLSVSAINITGFIGFIAVGKGQQFDFSNTVTTIIDVNLLVLSGNGTDYYQLPSFSTCGLYGITSNNSLIVVVGEGGCIYTSTNGSNYIGLDRTNVISTNGSIDIINLRNTTGLTLDDAVRFNNSFDTIVSGVTYYVAQIVSTSQIRVSSSTTNINATSIVAGNYYIIKSLGTTNWNTVAGTVAVTYNVNDAILAVTSGTGTGTARLVINISGLGTIPNFTEMFIYPVKDNLNDVYYANNKFIAVGDNGFIKISSNGLTWTTQISNTTENLLGIYYNNDDNIWIATGENNVILLSNDNGVTWQNNPVFLTTPTVYDVKGTNFTFGYGPEELIPGVVTDNIIMTITTRPGTNWETAQYEHSGYNVVSIELFPTSGTQTVYSFDVGEIYGIQNPAEIAVFVINGTTGLSTSIYENVSYGSSISYSINWLDFTITLSSSLSYIPVSDKLRIDIYEVGNGDQLVKASTKTDPIRLDNTTGWNEIYVNCNYTGDLYQGSGVIRPNTSPIEVICTETSSTGNTIKCDNVNGFILNNPITFQGTTFGNIVEDTIYYIKTISYVSNTITISTTFNVAAGTAGPTLNLVDAVGYMVAIIKIGYGEVFTNPIVYRNGSKLLLGTTSTVTRTKNSNNAVVCNSTAGLIVGERITFSNTMFGTIITPQTIYYIKTIIDDNEFTISTTLGGTTLTLTDATGGAKFISNDYAFGIQPNGISAKIIFSANTYTNSTDYITYTLFGETQPIQYGYTIPETQIFTGNNATTVFNLTNYSSGDNPNNAIVEINGIRKILTTDYTINVGLNTITFTSPPALNSKIAVTTYNLTDRQYLNSQYGITGKTVSKIIDISNTLNLYSAITDVTNTTVTTNIVTCNSTTGFVVNQTIQFKGTGFGNILTDGTVYFIKTVPSSTTFTISTTLGGATFALVTATGLMKAYVGGQPTVRVTTSANHNLTTNNLVRIDGTSGSTQLNNNTYYVHVISPTIVDLYLTSYSSSLTAINSIITGISSYTPGSGGYIWIYNNYYIISNVVTNTTNDPILGNYLTVANTNNLIANTPIIFTGTVFGGIVANTIYYIKNVITVTTFSISSERYGDEVVLTNTAGSMNATQWPQYNVDRLWITVNGYRVPSSSLKLNDYNQLSILTSISSTDTVIITSMIPSATPNEEVYLQLVNSNNAGTVYRANTQTRTWLTEPLYNIDTEINLFDVSRVTDVILQNSTTPSMINNQYSIGLNADKSAICNIIVYNDTKSQLISSTNYELVVESLSLVLKINSGSYITMGDSLTITILQGKVIYINGEQIGFTAADLVNNKLTGIIRGLNGTGEQEYIPEFTEVYGLLPNNKLNNLNYNETWNSSVYNETEGDPLQISISDSAIFLKGDIN